jgi:multidrug efflux pump subunit AcrA (membrane-fusion protein)
MMSNRVRTFAALSPSKAAISSHRPRGSHRDHVQTDEEAIGAVADYRQRGAAVVVAAPRWSRAGAGAIPTAVVQKGTFVDYLQVRGEIRPVRSIVLTAPSSGIDMQIVELAPNGATVAAGDPVVQFDPTTQLRTIEQRRSELKQAESEIDRIETESARRIQAAQTELTTARSAVERARLDAAGADLIPRVEAEKRLLLPMRNCRLRR